MPGFFQKATKTNPGITFNGILHLILHASTDKPKPEIQNFISPQRESQAKPDTKIISGTKICSQQGYSFD